MVQLPEVKGTVNNQKNIFNNQRTEMTDRGEHLLKNLVGIISTPQVEDFI